MSILNLRSVLTGIVATATMDILSVVSLKLGFIAFLPPRLTGRWFALMARGQFIHTDLSQTAPVNHEMAIALPVHYAIGVTLAILFLVVISGSGLSPRNPTLTVGFALFTTLLPWLVMFPAMGYGWFGTHGPPGTRLFVSSLVTHFFYGIGLWVGLLLLS